MWYANSRLGVTTWSCKVWGAAADQMGVQAAWFTQLSRIIERTSSFAITLLLDVIHDLHTAGRLEGTRRLKIWSDLGPHFKSFQMLGTLLHTVPERYKVSVTICYGLESHFKNPCDSFFGELERRRRNASAVAPIVSVQDLKRCYEDGAACQGSNRFEQLKEFWPPMKAGLVFSAVTAKSLPVPLSGCHCWEGKIVNMRRRSYLGAGGVLTNVRVWSKLVEGQKILSLPACHPHDRGAALGCRRRCGRISDEYFGRHAVVLRLEDQLSEGHARVRIDSLGICALETENGSLGVFADRSGQAAPLQRRGEGSI